MWRLLAFILAGWLLLSAGTTGAEETGPVIRWQSIVTEDYPRYLDRLRRAGCPPEHIQRIVVEDAGHHFDHCRLRDAIQWDFHWWEPWANPRTALLASLPPPSLAAQRDRLLARLLGTNQPTSLTPLSDGLKHNFTGPVLGAIPAERHAAAVELCERALQQMRNYRTQCSEEGKAVDTATESRMRQQTRKELARILTTPEMEEYLLRNAHSAKLLRLHLAGFNPTSDEFRAIFNATDPIQNALMDEYGDESALSPKQQEEYQRQYDLAVKESLTPERFKDWIRLRDVQFKRAQDDAARHSLKPSFIPQIYTLYASNTIRRAMLSTNLAMSVEAHREAGQAISRLELEFIQSLIKSSPRSEGR